MSAELVPLAPGLPASMDDWQRWLAECEDVTQIAKVRKLADAAKKYADSRPRANYAAAVSLRAARRGGELIADDERFHAGGPPRDHADTLSGCLGVESDAAAQQMSSRWQKLAIQVPEPVFEDYLAEWDEPSIEITYAGLLKTAHVSANSGDNEWYTPDEYIKAAVAVMGGVDLDPASSPEANEIVGASVYWTEAENGLAHPWAGRVWMNPPYARPLIDQFCGKLADSHSQGDVSAAIVLVNNATETGWFHALAEVAGAMCFPRHRIKFWHPRKEAVPLQGQTVIYLGDEIDRFRGEFVRFGFTVSL